MKLASLIGGLVRINVSLVIQLIVCLAVLHSLGCEAQPAAWGQKTKARPSPSSPVRPPGVIGVSQPAGPGVGNLKTNSAAPSLSSKEAPLPPARKILQDSFVDHPGGAVYSTGAEDIRLRILPNDPSPIAPRKRQWITGHTPVHSGIYLVSPGPERFIGYNIPGGGTVNLGRIPAAELVFAIKTFDGYTLKTGDAARNPDALDHAFTRTFLSGVIEVWFEDAPGPINTGRSDRDFDDVCIQLSGGVTGSAAVADLVKLIKEQKREPVKPRSLP